MFILNVCADSQNQCPLCTTMKSLDMWQIASCLPTTTTREILSSYLISENNNNNNVNALLPTIKNNTISHITASESW